MSSEAVYKQFLETRRVDVSFVSGSGQLCAGRFHSTDTDSGWDCHAPHGLCSPHAAARLKLGFHKQPWNGSPPDDCNLTHGHADWYGPGCCVGRASDVHSDLCAQRFSLKASGYRSSPALASLLERAI